MASPHLHHAGIAGAEGALPAGRDRGRADHRGRRSPSPAPAPTSPASARRARRDGDDWVLNGTKMFITNGVHADLYFVAAPRPAARAARGISMFIVEKGTPGFRVGRALNKTGWLSSDTAELVFDDCRIPAANLLGEENARLLFGDEELPDRAHRARPRWRSATATQALDADARLRARPPGLRRAAVGQAGDPPAPGDARRQDRAPRASTCTTAPGSSRRGATCVQEVSMLKALTGELVNEVCTACQQFHGGMGYMRGTRDRAAVARRARAGHRRRRDRGDARRSGEAMGTRVVSAMTTAHPGPNHAARQPSRRLLRTPFGLT